MAVLVKPFLAQGMGACCYLLFSVGREMIWLHKRRAAARALPVLGPELGFLRAPAHSINGKVSDTPNPQGLIPSMQNLGNAVQGESG